MSDENSVSVLPAGSDPLAPPPPIPEAPAKAEAKPRAPRKKAEKPAPAPAAKAEAKVMVRVKAKRIAFYHPYQQITIPTSHDVELPRDSWLNVQINAGVLEEIK